MSSEDISNTPKNKCLARQEGNARDEIWFGLEAKALTGRKNFGTSDLNGPIINQTYLLMNISPQNEAYCQQGYV